MLLYTKFGAMVPSGLASATQRRNWASRAQLGRNRGLLRSDDAVENISLYIDFPLLEFAHLSLFLREER